MADENYKRKLTAILSANVTGYSRLMGDDEVATVSTLKTHCNQINKTFQTSKKRVVNSPGDNILSEHKIIMDAVSCVVDFQEGLREQNDELPENRKMDFRIGFNIGDVIHTARVEGLADPGGIAIRKAASFVFHLITKRAIQ